MKKLSELCRLIESKFEFYDRIDTFETISKIKMEIMLETDGTETPIFIQLLIDSVVFRNKCN